MDKKQKQKRANLIMVALIVLIIAGGIAAAGFILGWFGGSGGSAKLTGVKGIVNMTRNSVTYAVNEDTELRKGDVIECMPGGSCLIHVASGSVISAAEQAKITVNDPSSGAFSSEIGNGEVFAIVTEEGKPVELTYADQKTTVRNAMVSVSVHADAQTLNVFSGNAGGIDAGNARQCVNGETEDVALSPKMLNSFAIRQLRGIGDGKGLCFTMAELDELEAERLKEQESLSQAAMLDSFDAEGYPLSCTVTIVCDTILDHMDIFDPAKVEFLPDDGVIADTVKVPFAEGETAYDVTKRACDALGIPVEASWTPLYDAYYIEGINNIYEFDCGSESGWMYKVNGWFPNYGCSSYQLEDGDNVLWCYTCVGLGVDVGGVGY